MLSAYTMQYLTQSGGLMTYVDIEDGSLAVAYKLVPVNCWHNGQQFPHDVTKDLKNHSFKTTKIEGLEYWLVPDSTTNSVGQVSHYGRAQSEATKPPALQDVSAPPAVQKYLKTEKRQFKRLG